MLEDKVALITGAGRGVGRAHALAAAAAGVKVMVNDLGGARPAWCRDQIAEELDLGKDD